MRLKYEDDWFVFFFVEPISNMSSEEIKEEEVKIDQNLTIILNDKINFELLYQKFSAGSSKIIQKTIQEILLPFFEKCKN